MNVNYKANFVYKLDKKRKMHLYSYSLGMNNGGQILKPKLFILALILVWNIYLPFVSLFAYFENGNKSKD